MLIGVCFDHNEKSLTYKKRAEIIFSPLFEMMASMHVICNPAHHLARTKWWKKMESELNHEVYEEVLKWSELTNEWLTTMDFGVVEPYSQLDLKDSLRQLRDTRLEEWNHIFVANKQRTITMAEKNGICHALENYAYAYFEKELAFLQPVMVREMKKQFEYLQINGFEEFLRGVHNRLKLCSKGLTFIKGRETHFEFNEIDNFIIMGSTFLSPHLIKGYWNGNVSIVKNYDMEKTEHIPPLELASIYNALGDPNRLLILKEMKRKPISTKELAVKLDITEAAVSKQLKILYESGIVKKQRKGNYMLYSIVTKQLDLLSYKIYEFL